MKTLYLDESGDGNMKVIDPDYPMFVLGGVIVDNEYVKVIDDKFNAFKKEIFGKTDIIMHTSDIRRKQGDFKCLKDDALLEKFYEKSNELMSELEYSVISCAFPKEKFNAFLKKHNIKSPNLYHLSLTVLVERFVRILKQSGDQGYIIAESQEETLDDRVLSIWENMKIKGTINLEGNEVRKSILDLKFGNKKSKLSGLEMADLVISPIGHQILATRNLPDWETVEQKLQSNKHKWIETGIVEYPENIVFLKNYRL